MSKRNTFPLYGGAIQANKIGSFVMGGETFHVIRPGYDIQGKRRLTWTQIVHEDVPVWAAKLNAPLSNVIERFEALWRTHVRDEAEVLHKALTLCKNEHRRKFKDGVSGESPAPALTKDGRRPGVRYPT